MHRITFHSISNAHACRMSAKTISLFYSCFKIENGTSSHTIFQKTDAQKLLCVFLSSFSAKDYLKIARQCKQTYAIFLPFVVSYYGYYEITSKITKKNIRARLKQFLFLFLFYNFFNCSCLRFSPTIIYSWRNFQSSRR